MVAALPPLPAPHMKRYCWKPSFQAYVAELVAVQDGVGAVIVVMPSVPTTCALTRAARLIATKKAFSHMSLRVRPPRC